MERFDPTLEGLNAKYRRARTMLEEARACSGRTARFDKLVAAIEPAVGIADQIEQPRKGPLRELRIGEAELRRFLKGELPHLELLSSLRVQDFHLAGLTERPAAAMIRGGIQLSASGPNQYVSHGLALPGLTPVTHATEGGSVKFDKHLVYQREDSFFDKETNAYIPLERLLSEFLDRAPSVIEWYRSRRGRPGL